MTRKLILIKNGLIQPENLDSLMVQEVLTSGYLYGLYFKEKITEIFEFLKMKIGRDKLPQDILGYLEENFKLAPKIGPKLESLLATGNLKSQSGLDLMQNNGYSIIAERLNVQRFWSHLKSIH